MFDNTTKKEEKKKGNFINSSTGGAIMKKLLVLMVIMMVASPIFAEEHKECADNFCFNPTCSKFVFDECQDDCEDEPDAWFCGKSQEEVEKMITEAKNEAPTEEVVVEEKSEADIEKVAASVNLEPYLKEAVKVYTKGIDDEAVADGKSEVKTEVKTDISDEKFLTITEVETAISEQKKRIKEIETEKLSCTQDKKNVESSKVEAGELHGYEEDANTEAHTQITSDVLSNLTPMADRCINTSDAKIAKVKEEIENLEKIKIGIQNLKLSSSDGSSSNTNSWTNNINFGGKLFYGLNLLIDNNIQKSMEAGVLFYFSYDFHLSKTWAVKPVIGAGYLQGFGYNKFQEKQSSFADGAAFMLTVGGQLEKNFSNKFLLRLNANGLFNFGKHCGVGMEAGLEGAIPFLFGKITFGAGMFYHRTNQTSGYYDEKPLPEKRKNLGPMFTIGFESK